MRYVSTSPKANTRKSGIILRPVRSKQLENRQHGRRKQEELPTQTKTPYRKQLAETSRWPAHQNPIVREGKDNETGGEKQIIASRFNPYNDSQQYGVWPTGSMFVERGGRAKCALCRNNGGIHHHFVCPYRPGVPRGANGEASEYQGESAGQWRPVLYGRRERDSKKRYD